MDNPQNFAAHPEAFGLTAPPPAAPSTYDYVGGNPELDQLLAMEADLYDKSKAIGEQLSEVKDRIKTALTSVTHQPWIRDLGPGQPTPTPFERYRIAVPGFATRVLRWKTSRRIDTKRLKAEQPGLYEAYSKESGAWFLERER